MRGMGFPRAVRTSPAICVDLGVRLSNLAGTGEGVEWRAPDVMRGFRAR